MRHGRRRDGEKARQTVNTAQDSRREADRTRESTPISTISSGLQKTRLNPAQPKITSKSEQQIRENRVDQLLWILTYTTKIDMVHRHELSSPAARERLARSLRSLELEHDL